MSYYKRFLLTKDSLKIKNRPGTSFLATFLMKVLLVSKVIFFRSYTKETSKTVVDTNFKYSKTF